ncbi:MAG TPA: DsbA family protein [Bryobacteraceae bacterium]|nr:DsbA family protein [Bryobacteraceae bacterium]
MSRPLFVALAAALLFAAVGPSQNPPKKSALDKAAFEAYVRHLFVIDSRVAVQVADPKPSTELTGFLDVAVTVTAGNQTQSLKFLVSKDGQKILQANIFDINNNPFKKELDKLKTEFEPSLGTPGAPVVLVDFSDFECPYCKEEGAMLRQNLLTAYPKQVRLYFKTFPLEQIHPWAKAGAIASRCVYRQQAADFWTFHDWIFAHQNDITAENLKNQVLEWAKSQKDIDALQLTQCMDTKATEAEVQKDLDEGKALEVGGTPTLFVNGRRLGTVDWPTLRSIIDYEIEYQKTAKNAGEDCGCELKLNLPGAPQQKTIPITPPSKK